MKRTVLRVAVVSNLLTACRDETPATAVDLGDIQLSPEHIDFGTLAWNQQAIRDLTITNTGDVPLGIEAIAFTRDGFESSFSIAYDFAQAVCEHGSQTSGGQVLDGRCSVPAHVTFAPQALGPLAAGILVVTADEPSDETDLAYYRDPDEEYKIAVVEGVATDAGPRILVTPGGLDFGFVWVGDTAFQQVKIRNVGDAPLTVGGIEFEQSFSDQFHVTAADPTDEPIEPGGSALLEVAYSPRTEDEVRDEPHTWMRIYSDDPDAPETEIELLADQAATEEDAAPTVTLISPPPGTIVNGATVEIELDIFDPNQPATTLSCRVMSALLKTSLADCSAPDESGHLLAEVPTKELEPGVDTLSIEVWDTFGQKTTVSTTVVYFTPAPANDGDGDGYAGVAFGGADCDDGDATVYPGAAEKADGKDNNCELNCVDDNLCGVTMNSCVDEGTSRGDGDQDCFVEDPTAANGGDCNDNDDAAYPGGIELVDYRDNDCDGLVDETLSRDDSDGDGFSPYESDCDDGNPDVNPASVERCDGTDEDCDGVLDDDGMCLPYDTVPTIIGRPRPALTDIGVGETVQIDATALDPDGDPLSFAWTQDESLDHVALVGAQDMAMFTAPAQLPDGADELTYEFMVQATDPSGKSDWAFGYVTVHDRPVETARGVDASGCGNGNETFLPLLPLAVLAGVRRRRRYAGGTQEPRT